MTNNTNQDQRQVIREAYGRIAQSGSSCGCGGGVSCCGSSQPQEIATAIGYGLEELAGVPGAANMGLSC